MFDQLGHVRIHSFDFLTLPSPPTPSREFGPSRLRGLPAFLRSLWLGAFPLAAWDGRDN